MNNRPLILRTLITVVVVLVFAGAIHPLFQRDYYETFLGMLTNKDDAEAVELVETARELQKKNPQLYQSQALLQAADCIIYAGSLVNPALLGLAKADCAIYNSAEMTLEQVAAVMKENEAAHKDTVLIHTGDPCLYGAIRERMDLLDAWGIAYDDTPGVSSFCGAAAALNAEYTLPGVSQTVIITRMEGRTPVPEGERLAALAAHGATMVIFLSIGLIDKVQAALLQGAYTAATPAAVVYKATWPEEKILRCTVGKLAAQTQAAGITKTALIVVGDFLAARYDRSCLYDPAFTTEYRRGTQP